MAPKKDRYVLIAVGGSRWFEDAQADLNKYAEDGYVLTDTFLEPVPPVTTNTVHRKLNKDSAAGRFRGLFIMEYVEDAVEGAVEEEKSTPSRPQAEKKVAEPRTAKKPAKATEEKPPVKPNEPLNETGSQEVHDEVHAKK